MSNGPSFTAGAGIYIDYAREFGYFSSYGFLGYIKTRAILSFWVFAELLSMLALQSICLLAISYLKKWIRLDRPIGVSVAYHVIWLLVTKVTAQLFTRPESMTFLFVNI